MSTQLVAMLSSGSGLAAADIEHIIATAPRRYKVFSIPKRRGGWRVIAQPSRELKVLQNLLVRRVLHSLPVHEVAHGYVSGRGIRSNAAAHVHSNFLLKMDLEDFFPSLRPDDLDRHLLRHGELGLSASERRQIHRLVFWQPRGLPGLRLCIGAPSSPFISNTLMYGLDESISEHATSLDVTYTRYADDLAFSCVEKGVLVQVEAAVTRIIQNSVSPALRVNRNKTVNMSRGHRRMLTGVVISATRELSLGRERKRLIRSMAHRRSLRLLSESEEAVLEGYLAFARDIEPDFVARLMAKFGAVLVDGRKPRPE